MKDLTVEELMEAGAHFGHQKKRFNPKMKRFVFGERSGVFIIDLAKTIFGLKRAKQCIEEVITHHKRILFVGTKKQAKEVVKRCAENVGEFYVTERWLGGLLTNLATICASVKKLEIIEKQIIAKDEGRTKKELALLEKTRQKLERNLAGVRSMRKPPGLLIVVDSSKEHIAVAEAKRLGIPIIGLIDTNCNPDPIDYVVACNDDALKSIKLILEQLCQTIIEKKKEMKIEQLNQDKKEQDVQNEEILPEEIDVFEKQFDKIQDKEEKDERIHS